MPRDMLLVLCLSAVLAAGYWAVWSFVHLL